jgi:hypothetical protein
MLTARLVMDQMSMLSARPHTKNVFSRAYSIVRRRLEPSIQGRDL